MAAAPCRHVLPFDRYETPQADLSRWLVLLDRLNSLASLARNKQSFVIIATTNDVPSKQSMLLKVRPGPALAYSALSNQVLYFSARRVRLRLLPSAAKLACHGLSCCRLWAEVADDSVPDSASSGSSSRCAAHRISLCARWAALREVAAATATHDTTARVADCCLVGLVVVYSGAVLLPCVASPQLVSCLAVGPYDGPEGPFRVLVTQVETAYCGVAAVLCVRTDWHHPPVQSAFD